MKLAPPAPYGWLSLAEFAAMLSLTTKHAGTIIQKEHIETLRQGKWLYVHQEQALALQARRQIKHCPPLNSVLPARRTTAAPPPTTHCEECGERGFFFVSNGAKGVPALYCFRCFLEHGWRKRHYLPYKGVLYVAYRKKTG